MTFNKVQLTTANAKSVLNNALIHESLGISYLNIKYVKALRNVVCKEIGFGYGTYFAFRYVYSYQTWKSLF